MAKNKNIKKSETYWEEHLGNLTEIAHDCDYLYDDFTRNGNIPYNDNESTLFNKIDNTIDELEADLRAYKELLGEILSKYEASTKKSKLKKSVGLEKIWQDWMNVSDAEAEAITDVFDEYGLDFDNVGGLIQLASDKVDGKNASTKKSKNIKKKSPRSVAYSLIDEGIRVLDVKEYDRDYEIIVDVDYSDAGHVYGLLPHDANVLEVIPYKGDKTIFRIAKSVSKTAEKPFNNMVKDIRSKNNTKKVI